ncbi:hypothetical protein MPLA_750123 [Mesorhizobium sp. ORS 3359]|nr:hypothetical protein MPLA_750123 [Mesorhizobium sp. ORS 3359]
MTSLTSNSLWDSYHFSDLVLQSLCEFSGRICYNAQPKRNAMPERIRSGSGLMVPRDGAVQNGYLTGLRSGVWLVLVD